MILFPELLVGIVLLLTVGVKSKVGNASGYGILNWRCNTAIAVPKSSITAALRLWGENNNNNIQRKENGMNKDLR